MPITENDIKLLESARMTDTPDGGGRMTGNVVQSGADNNIFDDVSNLDRVYGSVSLRKVFHAVVTNDTDKYLGARVIIDEPPADGYIEGTLFAASSLFDTRDAAKQRVEAYLAAGSPFQGLLNGPHIVGMLAISIFQSEDRPVPGIGDVLILRQQTGTAVVEQFVRITGVSETVFTFSDTSGDFKKRVITCNIADSLRYNFTGWEPVRVDSDLLYEGRTRLYTTVVANAAQYFGIRPLAAPVTAGAFSVQADTIFSQLLPSAQIETPVVDLKPNGERVVLSPAGGPVTLVADTLFDSTHSLAIGQSITPRTLTIVTAGETITDAGGTLVSGGVVVGAVDYTSGILTISTGSYPSQKAITYTPAAAPLRNLHTASWAVTAASRSSTVVGIFDPVPKPGTMTVSYRAEGRWYTLADAGDGILRSGTEASGAGTINFTTGSMVANFAALPDVGTQVLATYGLATAESLMPETPVQIESVFTLAHRGVAPSTVTVTWMAGAVNKTATDNGAGLLTGDATGTVDYVDGIITFKPLVVPSANAQVNIQYSWGDPFVETFTAPERFAPDGHIEVALAHPNVLPRTVRVEWNTVFNEGDLAVEGTITTTVIRTIRQEVRIDPIVIVSDNGAGSFSTRPETAGVVNYTAGTLRFIPDTTIALPKPKWKFIPLGTRIELRGVGAVVEVEDRKVLFDGFEYQTIGAEFPQGLDGYVKVTYRTTAAGTTNTEVFTMQPRLDLTKGSQEPIVPGSVGLLIGGTRYIDRQGSLLTAINPATGAGLVSGTINYASGIASLSVLPVGEANTGLIQGLVTQQSSMPVTDVQFRTSAAPLRVGSLSVQFVLADDAAAASIVVVAGSDGKFTSPHVQGEVNYETGVVSMRFGESRTALGNETAHWYNPDLIVDGKIFVSKAVFADTLRYAAVAYTYLPLDADILGLDPVRLPSDGRVPVFKAGRVVVVHNTQKLAAQAVSNGQTVDCGRTLLSRIRVFGNDGLEITSGFSKNLDAGTITFTNVAGMSQPVTIEHRIEDEALCAEAQINGGLRLTRPITHNYPATTSYVSSAYVKGTLQAAAQDSFSQEAWTSEWSDSPTGNPVLAQYDDTASPIVVVNAGAISERWALVFTSNTTFNLVGEEVGQIITGDTATPLAPVNPATGVPYFTLQSAGWGLGWAAGNVLRFNTTGANFPVWIARTVRQSPSAPPGSDQITISIRGDIDQ